MTNSTRTFLNDFTKDLLREMPEDKKQVLRNACYRNLILTSYYGLDNQSVRVYKEGWYIEMEGCRCRFAMWVGDNDGDFTYGNRKPREDKLSYLYSFSPDIDFMHNFEI